MDNSIIDLTVDLSNSSHSTKTIVAVQGDHIAREVHIKVLDNGTEYNLSSCHPILRGEKPDGKTVFLLCEKRDNRIIINLTSQLLVAEGFSTYEIALYENYNMDAVDNIEDINLEFYKDRGKLITSFPFKLKVTKSYYDVSNVVSSDEFKLCNDIVGDVARFEALVNSLPSDYKLTVAEVKRLDRDKEDKGVCYTKTQSDNLFKTIAASDLADAHLDSKITTVNNRANENTTEIETLKKQLEKMTKLVNDILNENVVYGFIEHYEYGADDPRRIEYIETNKDYTPFTQRAKATGGNSDYGSWNEFPFLVQNRPHMVNPDGTSAYRLFTDQDAVIEDINVNPDWTNHGEDSDKNVMAWIPRIYKYEEYITDEVENITGRIVKFSFNEKDGFYPMGFFDDNNQLLEGVWIPVFYGCAYDEFIEGVTDVEQPPQEGEPTDEENPTEPTVGTYTYERMRSLYCADRYPTSRMTVQQMQHAISTNGERFKFFGGAIMETLYDLMIMFAKSTDLVEFYGYGNYGSPTRTKNLANNWGQFTGTDSGNHDINRVFFSEVLGTHDMSQVDPYVFAMNGHIKLDYKYRFDETGASYIDTGVLYSNRSSWTAEDPCAFLSVDLAKIVPKYGSIPYDDQMNHVTDITNNGKSSTMLVNYKDIGNYNRVVLTRLGDRLLDPKYIRGKHYAFASTFSQYAENDIRGCSILILPPPGYKPYY